MNEPEPRHGQERKVFFGPSGACSPRPRRREERTFSRFQHRPVKTGVFRRYQTLKTRSHSRTNGRPRCATSAHDRSPRAAPRGYPTLPRAPPRAWSGTGQVNTQRARERAREEGGVGRQAPADAATASRCPREGEATPESSPGRTGRPGPPPTSESAFPSPPADATTSPSSFLPRPFVRPDREEAHHYKYRSPAVFPPHTSHASATASRKNTRSICHRGSASHTRPA